MNDTDLAEAYTRLADGVTPPADARDRVAARVTQRRRRRASASAALAVLVVLGVGAAVVRATTGPADDGAPVAHGPTTASDAYPFVSEEGLECPDGVVSSASIYSGVGRPFGAMLADLGDQRGPFAVDRGARRVSFLRDDGTVHTIASWLHVGPGWATDAVSSCSDASRWEDRRHDRDARPLALEVGHCWVEPVRFEGAAWDVVAGDQFGYGGGYPRGFQRSGVAWRAGDVVLYRDASGTLLTLVPEGDPWALDRPAGCR